MTFPSITVVLDNPLLLRNILVQADYETVLGYCCSYQQAQEICGDNVFFWEQKAQRDFNVFIDAFRNTRLSSAQRYLELLTKSGGV
jgi:hypothetical protein